MPDSIGRPGQGVEPSQRETLSVVLEQIVGQLAALESQLLDIRTRLSGPALASPAVAEKDPVVQGTLYLAVEGRSRVMSLQNLASDILNDL